MNIADRLFHLPDSEYQCCSHAHIAAGVTTMDDGKPMSINVETIGDALVIQHYHAEIHEPLLCRMVSISDAITKNGRSKVQVIWDLSAKPLDGESCEYTNHINAYATDEFIEFITEHGITFEQAAASRHFAKSIEGCALGKDWHTF